MQTLLKQFLFILFLTALGLCCSAWAFSSCSEWEPLLVVVLGLLIAVASLVAEHELQGTWAPVVAAHRLSSGSLEALECWLSSCGA